MKVTIRLFVAAILMTAIALATLPVGTARAAGSAEPTQGLPTTTFTFRADGYNHGEQIGIWINSPSGKIAKLPSIITNDNGSASWHWTAPADAEIGTWVMVGQGHDSGVSNTISIDVIAVAANGSVDPTEGAPGTTFTFTARGYLPNEHIGIWANTPSRNVIDANPNISSDANGVATWQWTAPTNAEGGTWRMTAQGNNSRVSNSIAFSINAPAATPPTQGNQPAGVTPATGSPGTTFTFYATGFTAGEELSYWAVTAAGETLVNNDTLTADAAGRVDFTWVAPQTPVYGTWTMVVYSPPTRAFQRISFQLTAPDGTTPAPAPSANGTVTPETGVSGTTFHFVLNGFTPEERMTYWTTAPDHSTSSSGKIFPAQADGTAVFDWTAPNPALEGDWLMVMYGFKSNITRSIRFHIGADTSSQPAQGVNPASGTAGTELTFYATGIQPTTLLDYFATDPNGVGEPVPHQVQADANGRAEWKWTIPQGAAPGTWTMSLQRARNDTSGGADVRRVITFEVR